MNQLNKSIHIRGSRAEVFQYFVDGSKMTTWSGKRAELEPVPGGTYLVEFENGDVITGNFQEIVPDEKLVYSASYGDVDTVVTILFSDEDGGTRINLTQTFKISDGSAFSEGWDYFLGILKSKLEGG